MPLSGIARLLVRAVSPPGTSLGPSPSIRAWIRYVAVLVAAGAGAWSLFAGVGPATGIGLVAAAVAAAA